MLKRTNLYSTGILAILMSVPPEGAHAGLIEKGQATMSIAVSQLSSPPGLLTYERFYGVPGDEAATLTRNQMVSPGFPPHPDSPTTPDDLVHPVNGTVTSPVGGGLRYRQSTNLDYDASDVLGSWAPSGWNGVKVLSDGEQIGLDGVIRMAFDPGLGGGTFLFGDYALRYAPTRPTTGSGLVITNNFDFTDSPLFDIGNAVISATPTSLSITGDLLLANEYVFFFGGVAGADVGNFQLQASVPEPSSLALAAIGLSVMAGAGWRRRQRHAARHAGTN